jgi:hypothetical protein
MKPIIGEGIAICRIKKPVVGLEPTARALRKRCSATELHRLANSIGVADVNDYTRARVCCQAFFRGGRWIWCGRRPHQIRSVPFRG